MKEADRNPAIAVLLRTLRGTLLGPDDPDYEPARGIRNGMIDRRPDLIARCQGVADVIAAGTPPANMGCWWQCVVGGHGVAGFGTSEGGITIDLSPMRAVRVDLAARHAWVQGGATWGDVDCETTAFGLATPGGLISTTGVGGLNLPAVGRPRGTRGLCVDNVISADVVTADGRLLRVSAEEIQIFTGVSAVAAAISALSSHSSSDSSR